MVGIRESLDDELSLPEWMAFVDSVSDFRPHLRFTGGEPFFRKDILDLVKYISAKDMSCSFITNGTLLEPEMIEVLLQSNVTQMNFSVDGDHVSDDQIRGKDAYEKTFTALETLVNIKNSKKQRYPDVIVNCVLTPSNIQGLKALSAKCDSLGVPLRLEHLMWINPAVLSDHQRHLQEEFQIQDPTMQGFLHSASAMDVVRLIDFLDEMECLGKSEGFPLYTTPLLTREEIRGWYSNSYIAHKAFCTYVTRAARIKANGDVTGCPYINYRFGNIRYGHFVDIYQVPAAIGFRERLSTKILPGCIRCCKL